MNHDDESAKALSKVINMEKYGSMVPSLQVPFNPSANLFLILDRSPAIKGFFSVHPVNIIRFNFFALSFLIHLLKWIEMCDFAELFEIGKRFDSAIDIIDVESGLYTRDVL